MIRRPGSGSVGLVAIGLGVLAVGTLVLQAVADRWHGQAVVPQSLGGRGLRIVVSDPALRPAVTHSLAVAGIVAVVATLLAWPAARHLAATGSRLGWAGLAAPILLPPLVLGDGLATWLVQLGLGRGLLGIGLAHLAVAIPYAAIGLVSAFGPELDELEHSAALLGAPPGRRIVQVVLPAARPQVALALALAFTVSWSQYGTSLTGGGGTPMLPLILVPYIRSDAQVAAVLSLAFLAPPVAALGAAARLGRATANRRTSIGGSASIEPQPASNQS